MTTYLPNLLVPPTVLSVSGLTSYIQALLEQDNELMQVWVIGEVSSAHRHRSGLFLTLQDQDEQTAIQCIVWKGYLDKLAIEPEPGEQVIVLGRIRVYPARGQYQLVVWQVLPAGEGLRSLRFQQLRNRLATEGLFDPERKRSLPSHPQCVAVVTSPQAAAWGDIQRTLKSRYPGLRVLFSPSVVQGDQAPASITAAIQRVEAEGTADVLIVSRGGGASEDLACFNNEQVVRAIANCPIPVISGIGHQRDETLADLAADCCAHTPTAAATLAVPLLQNLRAMHQERVCRLAHVAAHQYAAAREHLHEQQLQLQRLEPSRQVEQESIGLTVLRRRLQQSVYYRLQSHYQHQALLQQKLATLDPRGVLKRGYALARTQSGAIARQAAALTVGQPLELHLAEGTVQVVVTQLSSASALFSIHDCPNP